MALPEFQIGPPIGIPPGGGKAPHPTPGSSPAQHHKALLVAAKQQLFSDRQIIASEDAAKVMANREGALSEDGMFRTPRSRIIRNAHLTSLLNTGSPEGRRGRGRIGARAPGDPPRVGDPFLRPPDGPFTIAPTFAPRPSSPQVFRIAADSVPAAAAAAFGVTSDELAANARLKAAKVAAKRAGHQQVTINETSATLVGEDGRSVAAKIRKAIAVENLAETTPGPWRAAAATKLTRAQKAGRTRTKQKTQGFSGRLTGGSSRDNAFIGGTGTTYRGFTGTDRDKLKNFNIIEKARLGGGFGAARATRASANKATFRTTKLAARARDPTITPEWYRTAGGGPAIGGQGVDLRYQLIQIDDQFAVNSLDYRKGGTASTARRMYINSMVNRNPGITQAAAIRMWNGSSPEGIKQWQLYRQAVVRHIKDGTRLTRDVPAY